MATLQPPPSHENRNMSAPLARPHRAPMAAPSPRKALGELSANTLVSPHKYAAGHAHMNGLKRPVVSTLGDDKGFQYLKRRKLSITNHGYPQLPSSSPNPKPAHYPTMTSTGADQQLPRPTHNQPTPQNRSRMAADNAFSSDEDTVTSAKSQGSFASLIDFGPSSQTGNTPYPSIGSSRLGQESWNIHGHKPALHLPPCSHPKSIPLLANQIPHAELVSPRTVIDHPEQQAGTSQRVDVLRIKLRVALFKVLSGQIHTPFSRLRLRRNCIPCVPSRAEVALPKNSPMSLPAQAAPQPKRRPMHRSKASEMFGPALTEIVAAKNRQMSSSEETIVVSSERGDEGNEGMDRKMSGYDDEEDDTDDDDDLTITNIRR